MTLAGVDLKDVKDALKILPHGPEAIIKGLHITELKPGESAMGRVYLPENSRYFEGHFPYPATSCLPLHVVIEIAHQVIQVAIVSAFDKVKRGLLLPLGWGWDELRLRKPILPDNELTMEAKLLKPRRLIDDMSYYYKCLNGRAHIKGLCRGTVNGELIFEGVTYFILTPLGIAKIDSSLLTDLKLEIKSAD